MRVAFHVHGMVQGVGYRRFAAREADALGLAGWVRNEPDGSVCGVAEGGPEALAAFREALARGPAFGAVERLDWEPQTMGTSCPFPFEIRR
jgi:acylphosphatase